MPIPSLKEQFAALIEASSVSSTQAAYDQSNRAVVERLGSWLADLGFDCEYQLVKPGKFNLLARYGMGTGGLVLAGHTDTVPYDEALWRSDPLTLSERDGRWYGLGSCDMKGFFPLVLEAVKPLLDQPFRQPLTILATCDEESSMAGARALIAAGRSLGKAAVIGEPTGLKPIRLHKGIMMERLIIHGRSGHSSDPSVGSSALEAMQAALGEILTVRDEWQRQWRNPLFTVPVPTLNLGCIHGGDNPNRICGECALEFDLRPLPGMEPEALRTELQQRLATVLGPWNVTFSLVPIFLETPPFEEPAVSGLVRLAEKMSGSTAQAVAFATEAPYLQQLGCETLIWGPGDIACAHQPDEYLDLARIEPMVAMLRQLIIEYCLLPDQESTAV